MIRSPNEADFPPKQEGNGSDDHKAKASTSSTPWLTLKDPRIVRVSRALGGKDRHSKVCTIRGLRDRRVRLSVPTAIQLYDLQDRLGLNQPSKVVDWLLDAAKREIDELPPLPIAPGNFTLNHHPFDVTSSEASANQSNSSTHWKGSCDELERSHLWTSSSNTLWKSKSKEVSERENWTIRCYQENKQENNEAQGAQVLPSNLLPRGNHPASFLGLMNTVPFGYNWEPSNIPLSSHSGNHGFTCQTDEQQNVKDENTSQSLVCPTQASFPTHGTASLEIDPRQINHYHQMLSTSSQNLSPNSLSPSLYTMSRPTKNWSFSMTTPKLLPDSNESQPHKDGEFPPK